MGNGQNNVKSFLNKRKITEAMNVYIAAMTGAQCTIKSKQVVKVPEDFGDELRDDNRIWVARFGEFLLIAMDDGDGEPFVTLK